MSKCNVKNRTIFCQDNLEILRGINSNCIDLIYLDPPFNKNKRFTAPIGSSASGAEFSDIFREEDVKSEWLQTIDEDHPQLHQFLSGIRGVGKSYNFAYLAYMAIRLIECHRVLRSTGSLYIHCDPTMSHYLKILLDCVFGEDNFRNEVVWGYRTQGVSMKNWPKKHDVLLYYAKTKATTFHPQKQILIYAKPFRHTRINEKGQHFAEVYVRDVWDDDPETRALISQSTERTGYPTQKPLSLLRRIIKSSSNADDVVLDPFCGCATTCVAAEQLSRRWIGIDISVKAYELVNERLTKEAADPQDLFKYQNQIHMKVNAPARTDLDTSYAERKFVYVISNPDYPDVYKVGIAKNVKSRLNALQTANPKRNLALEYSYETPLYREIEKHIHQSFRSDHEWVRESLDKIIHEIENYAQNDANS